MMSSYTSVSVKDSIATKLLKVVFSIYLLIAVTVTLVHMGAEYYKTKDDILNDLKVFHGTFEAGLSQAIWDVNVSQENLLLNGIVKLPVIVGVKIETNDGISGAGVILNQKNEMVFLKGGSDSVLVEEKNKLFSGLFWYKFDIIYSDFYGSRTKVGEGTFYSSNKVVFQKIKYGFLFVIINAFIKTISLWIIFLYIGRILLSRPLFCLTSATEQLNLDNLENINIDIKTSGHNELKVLEEAFNTMVSKLLTSRNKLHEFNQTLELKVQERTLQLSEANKELREKNEMITQDLLVAQNIQKHLFTEYTNPPYLKIATKYLPHSHVSGDIYKIYPYENETYNLFLGDSTGHGVAAALSTVMANVLLLEKGRASLERIMEHLNEVFEQHLPDDRFMSAILANINPQGELRTIIAGHPPLIVIPANGNDPIILEGKGTLLGIFPKPVFMVQETKYKLMHGDKGILYTDGIYERENLDGKIFGIGGIRDFLKENRNHDLDFLLSHLLEHVNLYTQGKEADDDITIVAFEYIQP
ncbi:MAG: SpoIIE family protein phosphatase [SAR324 cluster bacterium]|nr:SpoIIE family protein phosphatase [SAR324 cluster bacterium]